MTEPIDCEHTHFIVCPHCGYRHMDDCENGLGDGDSKKTECANCERPFMVQCDISVTYSSRKIEP